MPIPLPQYLDREFDYHSTYVTSASELIEWCTTLPSLDRFGWHVEDGPDNSKIIRKKNPDGSLGFGGHLSHTTVTLGGFSVHIVALAPTPTPTYTHFAHADNTSVYGTLRFNQGPVGHGFPATIHCVVSDMHFMVFHTINQNINNTNGDDYGWIGFIQIDPFPYEFDEVPHYFVTPARVIPISAAFGAPASIFNRWNINSGGALVSRGFGFSTVTTAVHLVSSLMPDGLFVTNPLYIRTNNLSLGPLPNCLAASDGVSVSISLTQDNQEIIFLYVPRSNMLVRIE